MDQLKGSVFVVCMVTAIFMSLDWTWADFSSALNRAEKSGSKLNGMLYMPSFTINFAKNINSWMETLGVRSIFSPGEADLTPMLPSKEGEAFVRLLVKNIHFLVETTYESIFKKKRMLD